MNEDHYAIVIGLNNYPGLTDPPANLSGPENDADSIRDWLVAPKGGGLPPENVKLIKSSDFLTQPARPDAPWPGDLEKQAFHWIEALAQKNVAAMKGRKVGHRLYLYMSGHGFSTERRLGCLLTSDAQPNSTTANICASAWMHWWQDAAYFKEFVLLLDTCMNRITPAIPSYPPITAVNSLQAPGPTFTAFAAKRPKKAVEVPVAADAGKFHGIFTWAFLDGVKGAAVNSVGTVTGQSMANWLRNAIYQRLGPADRANLDVSLEPDIVAEDPLLILARGVAALEFDITLAFPADAVGKMMTIWSGAPPQQSEPFQAQARTSVRLPAGLHVVEVPAGGYRHGFEVVSSGIVNVEDIGPQILRPAGAEIFKVAIDAEGAANQISIESAEFEVIDNIERDRINASLPFGIYRSRIRVGRQFVDEVFMLDRDIALAHADPLDPNLELVVGSRGPLPRVASAIPFAGAPMSHEYQSHLVGHLASQPAPAAGKAQIAVVVRSWTADDMAAIPEPWEGVRLVDMRGRTIVKLDVDGKTDAQQKDTSAHSLSEVVPGPYFLRVPDGVGGLVELALPAVPGWRLEAYLLRSRNEQHESPPKIALLMRRAAQDWSDRQNETLEKAIIALAEGRSILNQELEELLLRRFENPIEGIVGAHLLLIQAQHDPATDLTLLNVVVEHLRGLLGRAHPDVEALSLRCPDDVLHAKTPFRTPPIFERSWGLMVEASRRDPALVPLELWRRVVAQAAIPPYLAWSVDPRTKNGVRNALIKAARIALPVAALEPQLTDVMLESFLPLDLVKGPPDSLTSFPEGEPIPHPGGSTRYGELTGVAGGLERSISVAAAAAQVEARRFVECYQLPYSAIGALQKKIRT